MALDKNDYTNLMTVMAQGQYNGIASAANAVALYNKLQVLAAQEDSNGGKPADSGDSPEPSADKPS